MPSSALTTMRPMRCGAYDAFHASAQSSSATGRTRSSPTRRSPKACRCHSARSVEATASVAAGSSAMWAITA